MITVKVAKEENRQRDKKRKRLVLTIGNKSWHIAREEALKLRDKLNRIKLEV